jgi:hypothetical protein
LASVVLLIRLMKTPHFKRIGSKLSLGEHQKMSAFALVESVIGMALISVMLSCVFAANTHLLGLLKQGKEGTFATQMIQERMDTVRSALWDQVTDPARLAAVIGPATVSEGSLSGVTETITVEPLVNPTNLSGQCVRTPAGTVTSSGSVLTGEQSVRVTVTVKWNSKHRARVRAASTVLTNGGI